MPLNPGAFYASLICIFPLKTGFNWNALNFIALCFNSFSSYQEIEKIEPKRRSSAAVVSSNLKWKVFHMDSWRWLQFTRVFQMQEDKTVTAFLPRYTVDNFLCFFRNKRDQLPLTLIAKPHIPVGEKLGQKRETP